MIPLWNINYHPDQVAWHELGHAIQAAMCGYDSYIFLDGKGGGQCKIIYPAGQTVWEAIQIDFAGMIGDYFLFCHEAKRKPTYMGLCRYLRSGGWGTWNSGAGDMEDYASILKEDLGITDKGRFSRMFQRHRQSVCTFAIDPVGLYGHMDKFVEYGPKITAANYAVVRVDEGQISIKV